MKNRNHKRLGHHSYCHHFVGGPSEELYMLMFRIEALTGPVRSQHAEETKTMLIFEMGAARETLYGKFF